MKNNRFFVINHDLSKSINDQVFYYTRIIRKNQGLGINNGYPFYPFYLIFKPYRVDFNYYGPNPDFREGEDVYQELKHVTIFSLPISSDYTVNDKLTSKLIELYDDKFRFDNCYSYNPDYDFLEEAKTSVFSYNCIADVSEDFNLPYKGYEGNNISLRTIFLDFLFDLNEVQREFNDFTYCPFFDEIETRLRQNDFFNALSSKYAFYYNRERIAEIANGNSGQKHLNTIQNELHFFGEANNDKRFRKKCLSLIPEFSPVTSDSECNLRALFRKHRISFSFEEFIRILNSKYWDSNKTKTMVFDDTISSYKSNQIEKHSRVNVELKKFVDCKNLWIKILEKSNTPTYILPKNKWWQHFEIELENVLFVKNETSEVSSLEKGELIRIETARWYSNRYDVIKSILIVLSQPFGKKKHAQDSINFQGTCLLLIYLGISVIATLFFIFNYKDKNTSSVLVYFSLANIVLIFIFTFFFLFAGFVNIVRYKKSDHHKMSIRTAGFFLPRLLMAIISGWIFLAIAGEELWKFELDIKYTTIFIICGVLFILMLFFLYLEIWKIKPKSVKSALSRSLTMLYIGLVYSFIVGFFIMMFTARKIIERADFLEKFAYSVIVNDDSYIQKKDPTLMKRYPFYNKENGKTKKQFNSIGQFEQWLSDSLTFNGYVEHGLLNKSDSIWDLLIVKQTELIENLDSLKLKDNGKDFWNSLNTNRQDKSVDEIFNLLKNIYPDQVASNPVLATKIAVQVHGLSLIRKKAINNDLMDLNSPKPFLNDYLVSEFLTNVYYDELIKLPIVQKVKIPFKEEPEIIFLGYFILNSFLALFIGVFLQMMFDNKNIAEPL